jgi:hypothetical protein
MSVVLKAEIIHLEGHCGVEDAETLTALLRAKPGRRVDLSRAAHLHAAVLGVLLVFRPGVSCFAEDPFIKAWIEPILTRNSHG